MMRHEVEFACLLMAASMSLGCVNEDAGNRAQLLASPAARRLTGTWASSFWLDRPGAMSRHVVNATPVTGTMAFVEDSRGPVSIEELTEPTHDGAYDIDFSQFGFVTRSSREFPGAVAQIEEHGVRRNVGVLRDSLQIILSPGTDLFVVRMTGEMRGDSVTGVWTASAARSDAGSGHFAMHRLNR